MRPPITHHTSHTMGEGAASSNSGCPGSGGSTITHHTSHTMENGASSGAGGSGGGEGVTISGKDDHGSGHTLEASLTGPVAQNQDLTTLNTNIEPNNADAESSLPTTPVESVMDSSDEGTTATGMTTMENSVNLASWSIIDTTLREGEQFVNTYFNREMKMQIAQALDDFGVEYIEVTSPAASQQSRDDLAAICKMGLKAKVLCHIRCHMDDARLAVAAGVDGINMCIGTSAQLMQHSHGKDLNFIAAKATEIIEYVRANNIEIRFSGEDTFRSDFPEIVKLYSLMDRLGADRVGIADTVGGATPMEVYEKVSAIRRAVSCDIETHFHNDTGCATANALMAIDAGATHIDTTVLGIGERNGITGIARLLAGLMPTQRDVIMAKYNLEKLAPLEEMVARFVNIQIPWNNPKMPVDC